MILIFAGAGASSAISPERYPTTELFYSKLKSNAEFENIINSTIGGYVNLIIQKKEQEDGRVTDIEKVLSYITQLEYDLSCGLDPRRISFEYISGRSIMDINKSKAAIGELKRLEKVIHQEIHNTYTKFDPGDIKLWSQFIERFIGIEMGDIIEVFTTNYDPIIEESINEDQGIRNQINTGIKLTGRGRAYYDYSFSDVRNKTYGGRFTKLHGSVDWKKEGDKIFITTEDSVPHKDYIIYPNLENKGIPDGGCFMSMHNHLRYACLRADIAIFVGFSFRDTYINQILSSISDHAVKIVINKDSLKSTLHEYFPFKEDDFFHIEDGFSEPSINKAMNYLQKLSNEGAI